MSNGWVTLSPRTWNTDVYILSHCTSCQIVTVHCSRSSRFPSYLPSLSHSYRWLSPTPHQHPDIHAAFDIKFPRPGWLGIFSADPITSTRIQLPRQKKNRARTFSGLIFNLGMLIDSHMRIPAFFVPLKSRYIAGCSFVLLSPFPPVPSSQQHATNPHSHPLLSPILRFSRCGGQFYSVPGGLPEGARYNRWRR